MKVVKPICAHVQEYCHEHVGGSGGNAPLFLNLGTRWKRIVITYRSRAVPSASEQRVGLVAMLADCTYSSADVARRLMLIAKRDKWQFVVKT
jgi:hypothetical protein